VLFGMAMRQTTGFVESLWRVIGLDWAVPDFSTLSRRQKTLKVNIPDRGSEGPLHLLVDSTGIKFEGEGAWNARKHGGTKRRVWRKIHIGIEEKSLDIRAAEFTTSEIGDVEPVSATGSSEPARDAARTVGPDPARSGHRHRHRRWRLRHPQRPRCHRRPWPCRVRACPRTGGGCCLTPERYPAHLEARRADDLATMERIPPPKPR
jgi:hypothetical protein